MTDWKARAEREAAAIIAEASGSGSVTGYEYPRLVELLAVAWLQGNIAGSHETLSEAEQAFDRLRTALS